MVYTADAVPWCGLFIARVMAEAGFAPPPVPVRARAWATWGSRLRPERIAPAAVMVFSGLLRGHVALYVGEDATHWHILGGNQGDTVSIVRRRKRRDLLAVRWPKGEPVIGGR